MMNKTVSLSSESLKAFQLKAIKHGGSAKSHMDEAIKDAATAFYKECADREGISLEEWLSNKDSI